MAGNRCHDAELERVASLEDLRIVETAFPELNQEQKTLADMELRRLLPNVLRTYLPWYTPHRIPFTPAMQEAAAQLTAAAKSAR